MGAGPAGTLPISGRDQLLPWRLLPTPPLRTSAQDRGLPGEDSHAESRPHSEHRQQFHVVAAGGTLPWSSRPPGEAPSICPSAPDERRACALRGLPGRGPPPPRSAVPQAREPHSCAPCRSGLWLGSLQEPPKLRPPPAAVSSFTGTRPRLCPYLLAASALCNDPRGQQGPVRLLPGPHRPVATRLAVFSSGNCSSAHPQGMQC